MQLHLDAWYWNSDSGTGAAQNPICTWSARGELQAEYTEGVAVRTFSWDAGGRMISATVFTLTTYFMYTGDGGRVAVGVEGYGTTEYIPDYACGGRVLVEKTATTSTLYLYGHECLAERRDGDWAYYLYDGTRYVRQVTDQEGEIESAWRYDPDGLVREGPQGPVSHLVCGGIYDVQNPASLDFPPSLNIPHRARIQARPEPASPRGVLPRKKAAGSLEPTALLDGQ